MKINFLATQIGDASGGAIYDRNFYNILVQKFQETRLLDDDYFLRKIKKQSAGLKEFNAIYKDYCADICDCDYLIMNSRIYTRFMLFSIKKMLKKNPSMKFIVIHHHNNYMTHKGILYVVHKHYELQVLKRATKLVIPNQYVIEQLEKKYKLKNIVCLPSSFEKEEYNISQLNTGNILFVGNVEKRKGLIYGLKAFNLFYKNNKNYVLRIAGKYSEDDLYYRELKQYIQKNDLDAAVIFEGRVTDERLNWLYSNSDVFLFPSLLEGYGWVMIEAMGRGVPVISFDNSAMPYTVKDNYNGRLIENLNWKEMGKALLDLLSSKDGLRELQKGALETYGNVPSQEQLNEQTKLFIDSWK